MVAAGRPVRLALEKSGPVRILRDVRHGPVESWIKSHPRPDFESANTPKLWRIAFRVQVLGLQPLAYMPPKRSAIPVPLFDGEFRRLDQALRAIPQTDPLFEVLRLETLAAGRAYLASINVLRICEWKVEAAMVKDKTERRGC
jgi:hypothetical protein